jgi:16S rRNA (uracil1498-N3)-methyltransferase
MDVRDARARLIVPALGAPGETLQLSREEAAHARARRLGPGDPVLLSDGSGVEAVAEIVRLSRGEAVVRVSEIVVRRTRRTPVTLYLAGLKPERLAWAVEKATELDAASVVIVRTGRTQSFRASAGLAPRLERIARESSKQCGRADWPTISGPVDLARVLEEERRAQRLLLDADGIRFPRRLALLPSALLVGPEGGWTDPEKAEASKRGWKIVALPAGTLRAETAAIAALALFNSAVER